jgi:DNA-binding CsgD family transcriptional regulator/tetratricopeptide (TPR) repeat protein
LRSSIAHFCFAGESWRLNRSGVVEAQRISHLVERDQPLQALRDCLSKAARGEGNSVLVTGEAGIGKTRILRALAESRGDIQLWWGACDALQTPHPLAPLYDIARSSGARFGSQLWDGSDRAALFESFIVELQQSARPTLLVVEDVHWADEATLDLLKFVGRRIDRLPCLLAISYRSDDLAIDHPLRRVIGELPSASVTHMELARLSADGVATLAQRALQSPKGIFEATNGNPLFVTELLRSTGNQMPRSIEDLVMGRFAQLTVESQAILHLVSIVPRHTERWLLEGLLDVSVEAFERCLNCGLLEADSDSIRFRHELARIVIENSLSAPAAQALHFRVLEVLVRYRGDGISAARLAHHAARAGKADAILEYAPQAAREAAQRKAHREAVAHYSVAISCSGSGNHPDRVYWLEAYAQECQFTAQLSEAINARKAAAELQRHAGNTVGEAENLSELAMAHLRAMQVAEADAASLQSIRLLESRAPSLELARAYRVRGHIRMLDRECDEAIDWSKKAIALAERFGGRDVLVAALGVLGAATAFVDYDAGVAHLRRAFDIAVSEGLDFMAAVIANNLGWVSAEVFRFSEARGHFLQSIAFARQRDIDSARTYATSWLAMCEMYLGHWDEAKKYALEVIESTDRTVSRGLALIALSRLLIRRGDPGVEPLLQEACSLVGPSDSLQRSGRVKTLCAEAALQRGDCARAIAEVRPMLALAARPNYEWFGGELTYLALLAGARDVARVPLAEPFALQIAGEFRDAAALWESLGCPYEQACALAEGDTPAQLDALLIFERLGARPAAGELRRRLRAHAVRGVSRGLRAATKANPCGLSERELEVLTLLCEGLRNSEIAERLCRSVRTVDHHVAAAFAKLRVSTRTEAVAAALRLGIPEVSSRSTPE